MPTYRRIFNVWCLKTAEFFFKLLLIFFVKILLSSFKKFRSKISNNNKNFYHKTLTSKKTYNRFKLNHHLLSFTGLHRVTSRVNSVQLLTHSRLNRFIPLFSCNHRPFNGLPSYYKILSLYPVLTNLYNINKGGLIFAKAYLASAVLMQKSDTYMVKLPSTKIISLTPWKSFATVYTSVRQHKKKITVRGIAKNPVDHPNGGNSNIKKPFKTPWGLIAKKNK